MKIKICGLYREEDVDYVNSSMPDYIGFIIDFPKSHRSISKEEAKILKNKLNPKIKAVGVFVNAPIQSIASICDEGIIDIIQLHGDEDDEYIGQLRKVTDKEIIKAFVVDDSFDSKKAEEFPADYILLDGGMGSGKKFSYEKIKDIKRQFFLAGGLSPENLGEITSLVQPFGVDMSSGVESEKMKDFKKIVSAVNQIHGGRNL